MVLGRHCWAVMSIVRSAEDNHHRQLPDAGNAERRQIHNRYLRSHDQRRIKQLVWLTSNPGHLKAKAGQLSPINCSKGMYSPRYKLRLIVTAENLTRASQSKQVICNAALLSKCSYPSNYTPFPEQLSRTSYASRQSTEMAKPLPVSHQLPAQLRSDSR